MRRNSALTADRARELFSYDKATGIFRWRCDGSIAGHREKGRRPILRLCIDGVRYVAARVAWLYVYGVWPASDLDHKDDDCTHDWIDNLRESSRSQNSCNKKIRSDNLSGFKGVTFKEGIYTARIAVNGKRTYLGSARSAAEAYALYVAAAQKFHGEFARVG